MTLSLLDTFRTLASFAPPRCSLADAPWEEYVGWAIAQGLAPLAAYNLEYRLGGAGAPEWAREQLLSVYHGSLNDTVMKLVHFKRTVGELAGRRILLLQGASFADTLYPHVAFRPLLDIELLVPGLEDMDALAGPLAAGGFHPAGEERRGGQVRRTLSDGRTQLILQAGLLGEARRTEEAAFFERALPVRVYGSSFFRLDLEDALLVACLENARAGFEVPALCFLDLRELLLGAPALGGPYSRPCDASRLRERAGALRLERALHASLAIVERLFPEVTDGAERARPALRTPTRRLLERLVVAPACALGGTRVTRGAARLRRWLASG